MALHRLKKPHEGTSETKEHNQHQQNDLNNYYQAKVGKGLANNSQNHLQSLNVVSVILHLCTLQNLAAKILEAGSCLKSLEGGQFL